MFGIKGLRPLGAFCYMGSLFTYLLVHKRDFDLLHVHQALYPAFISVFVGKQLVHKPVLVKTASSGMTSDIKMLKRFPFGGSQLRYLLRNMDCLVAVSERTGQDFKKLGFPESNVVYIPNGVQIPSYQRPVKKKPARVLTIARLSREKGIDVLLKAWSEVIKERTDLRLSIVGDGPLQAQMREMAQGLGVEPYVSFEGMMSNVEDFLREADLFVLPSRTEGMSNALLEAMSYGLPCVATNVGGNSELLGLDQPAVPSKGFAIGQNGLIVNSEDSEGLAKAILLFIEDSHLSEEMGRRSRCFIQERYSIETIADKYIVLYQELLSERSQDVRNLRSN